MRPLRGDNLLELRRDEEKIEHVFRLEILIGSEARGLFQQEEIGEIVEIGHELADLAFGTIELCEGEGIDFGDDGGDSGGAEKIPGALQNVELIAFDIDLDGLEGAGPGGDEEVVEFDLKGLGF